jgi:hypothetical protein
VSIIALSVVCDVKKLYIEYFQLGMRAV